MIPVFLACLLFNISTAFAQTTISYLYDDAGNRIERKIVLNTSLERSAKVDTIKTKEVFKDNLGDSKVLIYPNPTRGRLLVEISGYDKTSKTGLYLYDLSGSVILSKSPVTGSDQLDLSPFSIGTYVLKIVLGDKVSEWKIIKE